MKKIVTVFLMIPWMILMISSCGEDTFLNINGINVDFPELPVAPDNPLTEEGKHLGRMLFYETKLSRTNDLACASCHHQEHGFSDSNPVSFGVDSLMGTRQAMGLFNLAYSENGFFWDGRAPTLRELALEPIVNELELDETVENVIAKLSSEDIYQDQFTKAFGSDEITGEKIGLALEQFLTSMVSRNSKFDKFRRGEVELTESELNGRDLFISSDCDNCHTSFNFDDGANRFLNNGLDTDNEFMDFGRELVSERESDRAKFKVPSLRNIAVTGPYMHDGRIEHLIDVVEHYNSQIQESSTVAGEVLGGLNLSFDEMEDLVAFLETLTDEEFLNNPDFSSPF